MEDDKKSSVTVNRSIVDFRIRSTFKGFPSWEGGKRFRQFQGRTRSRITFSLDIVHHRSTRVTPFSESQDDHWSCYRCHSREAPEGHSLPRPLAKAFHSFTTSPITRNRVSTASSIFDIILKDADSKNISTTVYGLCDSLCVDLIHQHKSCTGQSPNLDCTWHRYHSSRELSTSSRDSDISRL